MTTTVIWMGDLLLSMSTLAPADDRTVDAIAQLLGLERTVMSSADPALSGQGALPIHATEATLFAPAPITTPSPPVEQAPPTRLSVHPEEEETPPASAASWFPAERLPSITPRTAASPRRDSINPLQLTATSSYSPPTPVPLLSPMAGPFIVQELVSSSRFGPDLDIDRLVDVLGRREIPQPVPLNECRTLARGAQVLVDDGEGMEPFTDDQQALVNLVRRLAGDALVDVRTIHEAPDPADPLDPWDPPPPRTPVLALTDLGLAGQNERGGLALVTAWRSAATTLAMRESSLTALIPYPAIRWPAQLAACIHLVFWDRSTTAAYARQAWREGPIR